MKREVSGLYLQKNGCRTEITGARGRAVVSKTWTLLRRCSVIQRSRDSLSACAHEIEQKCIYLVLMLLAKF
jgi:hypothetical protein